MHIPSVNQIKNKSITWEMTRRPREMLIGGGGSSTDPMLSGESVKTCPKENKSQKHEKWLL